MHQDACVRGSVRACMHACTCRRGTTLMCVCVGRSCAACVRVYWRTRVRYVFSNSESQAGSSNLHIYSFTVIQSSLKLARMRVSARPPRQCTGRTHAAGSSLIHNFSKGLMELQSSRHSPTIFFYTLVSCFAPVGGGGGREVRFSPPSQNTSFDVPRSIIDLDNIAHSVRYSRDGGLIHVNQSTNFLATRLFRRFSSDDTPVE